MNVEDIGLLDREPPTLFPIARHRDDTVRLQSPARTAENTASFVLCGQCAQRPQRRPHWPVTECDREDTSELAFRVAVDCKFSAFAYAWRARDHAARILDSMNALA